MTSIEQTDVVVVGSGYGGAIPAFHLAAAGARVVVLERGPWLDARDFDQDMKLGSYTDYVDLVIGDGAAVMAANCVGGGSVVNFAAALRAPGFVFEREGSVGMRQWPAALTRKTLDPWYERVERALPVAEQKWRDVSYAGGLFAAACHHTGRTCNPVPLAIDLDDCRNCGWQLNGCRFDAKRSMLLNYLPAAVARGARIRPLREVERIVPARSPGYRYRVEYAALDDGGAGGGQAIEAKIVILAAGALASPVILQRSEPALGTMPFAVGKFFSVNGDFMNVAVVDEAAVSRQLGLARSRDLAYQASGIGKNVGSMSFDGLRPDAPEFSRFSLQQMYFPPLANILAQAPNAREHPWFGIEKKEMRRRWRSWVMALAMTEDDNEGVFGPPPAHGSNTRIAPGLSQNALRYRPNANTMRGWAAATREFAEIMTAGGVAETAPWAVDVLGVVSTHPLSSCRMGDDPGTSALDDRHELRGHPGIFVTDGSAVPTSLCVNPSLTIAALAERAAKGIVACARNYGVRTSSGLGSVRSQANAVRP